MYIPQLAWKLTIMVLFLFNEITASPTLKQQAVTKAVPASNVKAVQVPAKVSIQAKSSAAAETPAAALVSGSACGANAQRTINSPMCTDVTCQGTNNETCTAVVPLTGLEFRRGADYCAQKPKLNCPCLIIMDGPRFKQQGDAAFMAFQQEWWTNLLAGKFRGSGNKMEEKGQKVNGAAKKDAKGTEKEKSLAKSSSVVAGSKDKKLKA